MKRLKFSDALLFAALLSAVGTLLGHGLSPLLGVALLSRGLGTVLAFAYVLFLLLRSDVKRGRLSLLVLWWLAALAIALLCPSLLSVVAAHVTIIWLVRALLFHRSLLAALADLALCALSLAAGCWALLETGSLFVSLWSLCLVQAASALLPANGVRTPVSHDSQRFAHAAQAAEQALRALSSSR